MDSIKKLTELFSKFPTVGPRTASRFVFHLIRQPKTNLDDIAKAIQDLKNNVKICKFCFQPFEDQKDLCSICSNPSRNKELLCIVEKEMDLIAIEGKKKYNGFYFIVTDESRINNLAERVKNPEKFGLNNVNFKEVIIAINPTVESSSISFSIEKSLKEIKNSMPELKITHLAKGLPVGGELEYADEETLKEAFEGRK